MTSPVEFPMYGKFKKTELSKENLLAFWDMILNRADFNVSTGEKVDDIKKGQDGIFTVVTANNQYRAHAVILALGRAGEPRKLGVKGEELPKVMYRLKVAPFRNWWARARGPGEICAEASTAGHRTKAASRIPRTSQRPPWRKVEMPFSCTGAVCEPT